MLMNPADRKLVKVESDQRATVRIDRKVGRPLKGQVRGLEDVELDHAHVTIEYFGAQEGQWNGRPYTPGTAFDAIPITSQGDFTTDPIPPGKYTMRLWAVRPTDSNESTRYADFDGSVSFTVPPEGDMPTVELVAKAGRPRGGAPITSPLHVVDEQGKPVSSFRVQFWTGNEGNSHWLKGSKGQINQVPALWGFAKEAQSARTLSSVPTALRRRCSISPAPIWQNFATANSTVVLRRGEHGANRLPPAARHDLARRLRTGDLF